MEKQPMTQIGFDKITKELEELTTVSRNQIAAEIGAAVELGDLKENAEYHAAKEKQVHLEKRIALLQEFVLKAQVIDPSSFSHNRVSFGSTVKVLDNLITDEDYEYISDIIQLIAESVHRWNTVPADRYLLAQDYKLKCKGQ